jgi:hypothetical protein
MAFVNIPPNLQDMFNGIYDRLSKLETGPNQAMYTAESAQGSATQATAEAQAAYALGVQAQNEATQALIAAQSAYALGSQALIKDANTITNASNQLTAINTNGITVYSGGSASSGARVVMNSAGIAGYNSSNTATFAINASTGAVSTLGAIFTSSTISGGSLNINGNAIIDSSGYLTAYGATIQGTITSNAATITGGSLTVGANFQVNTSGVLTASNANITGAITANSGTIGGWTIASGQLYSGSSSMNASTGNAAFNNITAFGYLYATSYTQLMSTLYVASTLTVDSSATFGTSNQFQYLSSSGTLRSAYTYGKAVTGRAMQINSTGDFGTTASTLRKKHEIEPYSIDTSKLLQLGVKTFKYLPEIDEYQEQQYGFIAEEAESLGLLPLVLYNNEGQVDYFAYEKLPIFLLQLAQEQEARIKALEGN